MCPPTRPSHTRLSCELKGAEIIPSEGRNLKKKKKPYCSSRSGKKPVACCNPESPWGALARRVGWEGGAERGRERGRAPCHRRAGARGLSKPRGHRAHTRSPSLLRTSVPDLRDRVPVRRRPAPSSAGSIFPAPQTPASWVGEGGRGQGGGEGGQRRHLV